MFGNLSSEEMASLFNKANREMYEANLRVLVHPTKPPLQVLLENTRRVESTGCLIWLGAKNKKGYGTVTFEGRSWNVHRLAYALKYGDIPRGMVVCHNCPGGDNSSCVNYTHMFLGTDSDNSRDYWKKGGKANITFRDVPCFDPCAILLARQCSLVSKGVMELKRMATPLKRSLRGWDLDEDLLGFDEWREQNN